ncbi:TPA: ABC transporter ATP-binding protein [Candidatus Poribacteria bacterium]|jgi:putative ABC transport system ATP-binding protein|nr:ABC transporter ATP-binding protein [Candidatus Poribacteria bacterium]HIA64997.1 ABC transporter ATP-binding protein [Candidatus Poribacteria bacterium]HIB89996.1 ABC transporter ATP-binding protein [Candidatus Poribacteria bacterium]HIC02932.1 ABC transporter ATP-binding protein [Candidatus Poribacteria bacterium]HIO06098.1 ABC transporter ATP-binding protein [Candidatus Poribacteria bacterium]
MISPLKKKTHIRLDKVSKIYVEAKKDLTVLNQVDEVFHKGEFICVLGKSGSGKSTLLNLISGIDVPTQGRIIISSDNQDISISDLTEKDRTLFRRRHIGIIFQFFNLIPTLNVLENVTLPLELNGNFSIEVATSLMNRVGLGNRLETYPDKLSAGEQQRVAITRALVHNPSIILADEPTGNLDAETGNLVLAILLEFVQDFGQTLLLVTHDHEIASHADRVLQMTNGKLTVIENSVN